MVYTDGVHLIADTVHELHVFARRLGLKREWFQDKAKIQHYDLLGGKLHKALQLGARFVTSRNLVETYRRIYG